MRTNKNRPSLTPPLLLPPPCQPLHTSMHACQQSLLLLLHTVSSIHKSALLYPYSYIYVYSRNYYFHLLAAAAAAADDANGDDWLKDLAGSGAAAAAGAHAALLGWWLVSGT